MPDFSGKRNQYINVLRAALIPETFGKLNANELTALTWVILRGSTKDPGAFYAAKVEYWADKLGMSKRTLQETLARLRQRGLLVKAKGRDFNNVERMGWRVPEEALRHIQTVKAERILRSV